jgi:hypothetical protein
MDIDPSHLVSVFGQFSQSSHLLGGRTASPIAHGLDILFLVAAESPNRAARPQFNSLAHRVLLHPSFYQPVS